VSITTYRLQFHYHFKPNATFRAHRSSRCTTVSLRLTHKCFAVKYFTAVSHSKSLKVWQYIPEAHKQILTGRWGRPEKKNFWEELIAFFPSTLHRQHRKGRLKKFFYCCVCIHYHGNVSRRLEMICWDTRTDTQTDGRNLWSTPLRWAQVPWYTLQLS
jgi:hypothetical protein